MTRENDERKLKDDQTDARSVPVFLSGRQSPIRMDGKLGYRHRSGEPCPEICTRVILDASGGVPGDLTGSIEASRGKTLVRLKVRCESATTKPDLQLGKPAVAREPSRPTDPSWWLGFATRPRQQPGERLAGGDP